MCVGISLRDTPGPFPRQHWCWLPKTAHPPPLLRQTNCSPSPSSLPHLWVFTFAVPWAWHPLSSLCTKLLLMLQGPAQMSSSPACGGSAAIELPSIRHRGNPNPSSPGDSSPVLHTHTPKVELAGLTPCLGWRVCMPREAPPRGQGARALTAEVQAMGSTLRGRGGGKELSSGCSGGQRSPCALLCGDLGADSWSAARPARLAGAFPRRYWALGASTGKMATSCSSGGPTGLGGWAVEGGASQGAPDAQGQELVSHHP